MTTSGLITVAILCGRRPSPVAAALESLAGGTVIPAQVLLIDTVGDGLQNLRPEQSAPIELRVLGKVDGGYAEARNVAVSEAETEFVAFIDDDCTVHASWLERMLAAIEHADAVGGPTLPLKRPLRAARFCPEWNSFVGLSSPGFWSEFAGRTELPQTANMIIRREALESLPFPTQSGSFSGDEGADRRLGREDVEWWRAARRAGLRCVVEHRAVVWHDIDPVRYERAAVDARASSDGATRWERLHERGDLDRAARDIASVPRRVVRDLFDAGLSTREAIDRHAPWARRQWRLLQTASDDHEAHFTPPERTGAVARALGREVVSAAKPLVRQTARAASRLARQRPEDLAERRLDRLLFVCHDYLGDAVLCEPLLAALRRRTGAELEVLCGPCNAGVFRMMGDIDRVTVFDPPQHDRIGTTKELARLVKQAEADAMLIAYFHHPAVEGLYAPGGPPRIAWAKDQGFTRQTWADIADIVVPKSLRKHELAALLDLAVPFGVPTRLRRPRLEIPHKAQSAVAGLLASFGVNSHEYIAVHFDGPEGTWKAWPRAHFVELVRGLREKTEAPVILVGSSEGADASREVCEADRGVHSLHGQLKPAELAAVLQGAKLFIGPDSGPAHLAQAVRANSLILFGPTEEWRWGPLPRLRGEEGELPFRTVRAPDAPADWMAEETDGFGGDEHMLRLRPGVVLDAAVDMLSERGA